jgi:hypothetical protein
VRQSSSLLNPADSVEVNLGGSSQSTLGQTPSTPQQRDTFSGMSSSDGGRHRVFLSYPESRTT